MVMREFLDIVFPGRSTAPGIAPRRAMPEGDCFHTRLPSSDSGLYFAATFTLRLDVGGRGRRNIDRIRMDARIAVRDFAARRTRDHSVADPPLAEAHVRRALFGADIVEDPDVRAADITVTLTAEDDDKELVRRRERHIATREVEAEEHRTRLARIQRVTRDVYTDPVTTLRWWYDSPETQVDQLAKAADQLQVLLEHPAEDEQPESVGTVVDELLAGLDPATRAAVVGRMAELCVGFSRRDLAKRLHASHFDTAE